MSVFVPVPTSRMTGTRTQRHPIGGEPTGLQRRVHRPDDDAEAAEREYCRRRNAAAPRGVAPLKGTLHCCARCPAGPVRQGRRPRLARKSSEAANANTRGSDAPAMTSYADSLTNMPPDTNEMDGFKSFADTMR